MVDQITPTHIQHGTSRNNCAEAHFFAVAPVEDRGQECATLTQKRDVTRLRRIFSERGIQSDCRVHDAQAIGTNQAHGTAAQLLSNLLFECSAFRTTFPESSRNHNRGLGAGIHTLPNELRDGCCRSGNYSQVHQSGDVTNASVGLEPKHFRMLRVDGIHLALKATAQQVLKNGPPHCAGPTCGANDGHRAWREHCVQAVSLRCCLFLRIRWLFHETRLG